MESRVIASRLPRISRSFDFIAAHDNRWPKMLLCIAIGLVIALVPIPGGLTNSAWHLFAIFVATALAFVLRPFPSGTVTLLALTVAMLLRILTVSQAFVGFTSDIIWLIVAAFLFSRGLVKSGLGERLAYRLLEAFGSSSLKLSYALSLGDLLISLIIPSNAARAGGVVLPIVKSVAEASGSDAVRHPRKLGAFLIESVIHCDNVASALTMNSMDGNMLVVGFAATIAGVRLNWGLWLLSACVPALIAFILQPLAIYRFYPPEQTKTPEVKGIARERLAEMGHMGHREKLLAALFCVTILGWATSSITGINVAVVALTGLSLLLLTGLLDWNDVIHESGAWNVMFWMGGMFGLASNLASMNIFKVFADFVAICIDGVSWPAALLILVLFHAFLTYGFASGISHVLALYPVLLTVAITVGAPPFLATMALGVCNAMYQMLTHYSSGAAAVYFGSGYVPQGTWWRINLMMMMINLTVWGCVGVTWWKIIGLW